MNKRFLCGIWYAISICLTGGTHNPTIAASQLSWGHTAPFCGVIMINRRNSIQTNIPTVTMPKLLLQI